MAKPRRVTIDEKFNAEYAKKGMQPYVSNDGRVRNVKMEKRPAANDMQYEQGAANDPAYEQPKRANARSTQRTQRAPSRFVRRQYTRSKLLAKKVGKKKKTSLKSRGKATAVNAGILSWLAPSWFFFQLPFALLNIVFFGIFNFTSDLTEGAGVTEEGVEEGFLLKSVKFIASTLNAAIEALTGFDFGALVSSALDLPGKIYLATTSIILAYALIVLATMSFLYLFARLKPFSGSGSTMKIGAFLLCIIGYTIPLLNLFPWAILWAAAVWKNPK